MTKIVVAEILKIQAKVKYARIHSPQQGREFKDRETGKVKIMADSYTLSVLCDDPHVKTHLINLKQQYTIPTELKADKEGDLVFNMRRDVEHPDDDDTVILNPLRVKDSEGNPLSDKVLVGNGSLCNIAFRLQPYTDATKRKCHKVILTEVQVLNLVPYERPVIEEPEAFSGPNVQ